MPTNPPAKIVPKSLNDYLEIMSKSVFQSGMSWKVIESKWPGIREAFRGFDSEPLKGHLLIHRKSEGMRFPVMLHLPDKTITPIERKRSIEAVSIQLSAISLRPFD